MENNSHHIPGLVDAMQSCLLVVDMQPRLLAAMAEADAVVNNCEKLLKAAALLEIPAIASEQYPHGLGSTDERLSSLIDESSIFEKMEFSALLNSKLASGLEALKRPQVIVTGLEAHVCVLQSVFDLAAHGYSVFVVADAISSRRLADKEVALHRFKHPNIAVVTTEMVVFEWLRAATHPKFKQLSALVK